VYAIGTELWLGMANMRIHRPSTRSVLTVLNDCEPPLTCAMARVRPCVGRTEPVDKGIQSICCLKMLDLAGRGKEVSRVTKVLGDEVDKELSQLCGTRVWQLSQRIDVAVEV